MLAKNKDIVTRVDKDNAIVIMDKKVGAATLAFLLTLFDNVMYFT